jgi:hypothetical protein
VVGYLKLSSRYRSGGLNRPNIALRAYGPYRHSPEFLAPRVRPALENDHHDHDFSQSKAALAMGIVSSEFDE